MLDIIFLALLILGFSSVTFFAKWCEGQVNEAH
ncbi:hypothetical protein CLOSAC_02390 [Clostridium saccharobutylicum]|uniref:Uncharacterized protein n=1 Tax=Clostridium saccharobutylicum TaxID=169679 RepID=A0A1S8NHT5_CLOSA|nr:hypothetical protein CLOSAC_02390 [Clostridium saccharobutylicum]